jgi:hypothetical protein
VAELTCGISGKWKKSSASGGGDCVEVRRTPSGVQVRHSKNPTGAVLDFTDDEWLAFLKGVARREFHIPEVSAQCTI